MRPFKISVHIIEPTAFRTPILLLQNRLANVPQTFEKLSQTVKDEYGEEFVAKCKKV